MSFLIPKQVVGQRVQLVKKMPMCKKGEGFLFEVNLNH